MQENRITTTLKLYIVHMSLLEPDPKVYKQNYFYLIQIQLDLGIKYLMLLLDICSYL